MNLPDRRTSDVGLLTGSFRHTYFVRIIFGALGVLFSLLTRLLAPPPGILQKALEPKQPPWMAPVQQFLDLVITVEGTLALFGICAFFAVYTLYQPRALLFAFLAGLYLANALFR